MDEERNRGTNFLRRLGEVRVMLRVRLGMEEVDLEDKEELGLEDEEIGELSGEETIG